MFIVFFFSFFFAIFCVEAMSGNARTVRFCGRMRSFGFAIFLCKCLSALACACMCVLWLYALVDVCTHVLRVYMRVFVLVSLYARFCACMRLLMFCTLLF